MEAATFQPRLRVLLVCAGNTCRSPMAQAFLAEAAAREGLPVAFESAGVNAASGCPASETAVSVLREMGLDVSTHRSRCLPDDLGEFDLILTMTRSQKALVGLVAGEGARVFTLKGFAGLGEEDIPDPIGSSPAEYRKLAEELRSLVPPVLGRIKRILWGEEDESCA